ncbi:hypothetical protein [Paenibacillus sp. 481]|uniref:hypothetical protein n=1 Tax=Paenibacillus sp. 481 TaxID=2835869 RepID=UPI001E3BD11C|nr:hypothetical protein [Paenibacillus sp. 481]UHA71944.1 hypothetical protein KIK04_14520 [Paenibacillus sp. 481]
MAFTKPLPEWKKAGTRPPDSKIIEGYNVMDKPPASWLNWQMNTTYEALQEIQQKAAEKTELTQSLTDAKNHANTVAAQAETNAKNASLSRGGGAISGSLSVNDILSVYSWGALSSGTGGNVLLGQNCYIDKAKNTFHFKENHPNMGARGILLIHGKEGCWIFDTGVMETKKDVAFTPTLTKLETVNEAVARIEQAVKKGEEIRFDLKAGSKSQGITWEGLSDKFRIYAEEIAGIETSRLVIESSDNANDTIVFRNSEIGTTSKDVMEVKRDSVDVHGRLVANGMDIIGEINHLKQSGVDAKHKIAGAINAKGIAASANDTFNDLSGKISNIFKGYANGIRTVARFEAAISVPLEFMPAVVVMYLKVNGIYTCASMFVQVSPHHTQVVHGDMTLIKSINVAGKGFTFDIDWNKPLSGSSLDVKWIAF